MSSTDSPPPAVPSYISHNRFVTVADNNHSGSIWIATLLCAIYSTLVLLMRLHIRWKMYGLDDYLVLLATAFQTAEVVMISSALRNGLGQSLDIIAVSDLESLSRATFVGIALFIVTSCLAKCSVVVLVIRVFNLHGPRAAVDRRTRILLTACLCILLLTVAWGIGSIIGLTVGCSPTALIGTDTSDTCPSQPLRWNIISTFDILSELSFVILSMIIVAPLHLRLGVKLPIVLAFAFRLPCAGLSLMHVIFANRSVHNGDQGIAMVPVIVVMQVQLCWQLISATLPTLKSFVRSFNSGVGLGLDLDLVSGYASSRGRRRGTNDGGTFDTKTGRSTPSNDTIGSFSRPNTVRMRTKESNKGFYSGSLHGSPIPMAEQPQSPKQGVRLQSLTQPKCPLPKSVVVNEPRRQTIGAAVSIYRPEHDMNLPRLTITNASAIDISSSEADAVRQGHFYADNCETTESGIIRKDVQWEVAYETDDKVISNTHQNGP